jgi:hypothetical protein
VSYRILYWKLSEQFGAVHGNNYSFLNQLVLAAEKTAAGANSLINLLKKKKMGRGKIENQTNK